MLMEIPRVLVLVFLVIIAVPHRIYAVGQVVVIQTLNFAVALRKVTNLVVILVKFAIRILVA